MILLTSGSLTPVKLIDEQEKELTICERDSTASISVTSTDGISVNSWIKDDNGPGTGIVWRVKGIRQNFGKGLPEVDLEHVINTLKDRILFGEITPETIAGSGATTCTALQAVTYILNQQSDWVLGTFSFSSVSSAYKFDGDNLLDALKKVSNTLEEPCWSYDMSSYPFTLNITAKPSGVACEMRAGRNLETISRTIDKTGMYTRFYPIGKDDLHISGNYVSKNESTYGIISKVETDQSIDTTAGLTAWANERLNKHAQPRVNITAKGLAIADATGEALDSLTLGRICRVPLPEYSTTIEERITELHYADAKNKPEDVNVTLSNEKDDRTTFAQLISNEIKSGAGPGGSGARGGARQSKEDHAWLEDNTDSIGMVVGTYQGNKFIKAGEITLAINATTGETMAKIMANHVFMTSGQSESPIDVVIDGKLTTTDLESEIALLSSVRINTLNITTLIDAPKITGTEALIDEISCDILNGKYPEWASKSVVTSIGTSSHTQNFRLADGTTWNHKVVTDVNYNTSTIYYLAYDP